MSGGKRQTQEQLDDGRVKGKKEERRLRREADEQAKLEKLRVSVEALRDQDSAPVGNLVAQADNLSEQTEHFKKTSKKTSPSIGSRIANAFRRFARWIASFFTKKEVEHRDDAAPTGAGIMADADADAARSTQCDQQQVPLSRSPSVNMDFEERNVPPAIAPQHQGRGSRVEHADSSPQGLVERGQGFNQATRQLLNQAAASDRQPWYQSLRNLFK